ncbi:unnamed protein product [Adineta steineri]|uniref:Homeobox domain-containing protein n=1 Tax=Adineta steineri TaxID=433720 RepID=A0A815UTL1_9BILA|nr:unnamed protein product [Adineta steineri]CAF1650111.1 unnamed protein product [Adineta steineri]
MAIATSHHGQNQSINESNRKHQRIERQFTSDQIAALEIEFIYAKYMTRHGRIRIARKLGLNERQVKIWFFSRRKKWQNESRISNHPHGYLNVNTTN